MAVKNIPAKIVSVMKPIGMKVEEDVIFSGQPMPPYYKDLHIQCVFTAYPITHYDKKEDKDVTVGDVLQQLSQTKDDQVLDMMRLRCPNTWSSQYLSDLVHSVHLYLRSARQKHNPTVLTVQRSTIFFWGGGGFLPFTLKEGPSDLMLEGKVPLPR